jgi:drug/metabolite transporter superfamily protein YnfA
MFSAIVTAWLLLLIGDFLSTFCYHVPEHVFGRLHVQTHHSAKQTFRHYAVLSFNLQVLLDGILGALPYLLIAIPLWQISPVGVITGLLLGQLHVWWRHTLTLNWQTPPFVVKLCQVLWITTPEQHWLHHQKTTAAYGDIFTCFDLPAKGWFRFLRRLRYYWYQSPGQRCCSISS